jgi:tetratricopeptide (TPR) repeat protein
MKPYRSLAATGALRRLILIAFIVINLVAPACALKRSLAKKEVLSTAPKLGSDPLSQSGFDHFYNMEYDKAIHDFELDVQQHPQDPLAANHLLTAVLFKELYRIGAMDTEIYANDSFLSVRQFSVDPKVRQRIRDLTDRALALSEQRLQANPNDVLALYARGSTRATRAMTVGVMDKSWFAALRNAIGARHDEERVLELDPGNTDAKMALGTHCYILGSLSWAVKVAASVVGLTGSKEKGLQYLYEAANGGGETSVDAKIVLSLFLRREQRYPEAINLIGGLTRDYPRSFLLALEYANLLNAAGHGPEAIAAFRTILAKNGQYQEPKLEQVGWGLGEALRGQNQFQQAAAAYDSVGRFARVEPDLLARANLAAGEMYDVMQKRDLAVQRYRLVIAVSGDSSHADQARKYLKRPYRQ